MGQRDVGKIFKVVVLYPQKSKSILISSAPVVRKWGQCGRPELALHLILEVVGVGELAGAWRKYRCAIQGGHFGLGHVLDKDVGNPVVDPRQQKNRSEYNGKQIFVFKVFSRCLWVSWGHMVERGAWRDFWNRPLLPCHKGMDFIPNLLLGKTLCDKGYSLFISAQHIVKHWKVFLSSKHVYTCPSLHYSI